MNLITIEKVNHLLLPFSKAAIYGILNLVNGKIYIGSAVYANGRWSSHKNNLRANKHVNVYLQRAWNKYSELAFEFTVLEYVLNKNSLVEREQYWINLTNCNDPDIGYNIRKDVRTNLGLKYPIRLTRKANLGRVHSAEHRAKNSAANKGHIVTQETKIKIGTANGRQDLWPHEKRYNCNCRECLNKKNLVRRLKRYNHEGEFSQ